MSLITLNSNGQSPYLWNNHFPQPIKIKPFSQVCVLKFLHFRDSEKYSISQSSNTIKFNIGNTQFDAIRIARIPVGTYSGDDLATAIQDAMNLVLQQQNYTFTCEFKPLDPTFSPPTPNPDELRAEAQFTISIASVTAPAVSQMTFEQLSSPPEVDVNQALQPGSTVLSMANQPSDGTETIINEKGILTHEGSFIMENIGWDYGEFVNGDYGFNVQTIGICRNVISDLVNATPDLAFNQFKQDCWVALSRTGVTIGTIDLRPNGEYGDPGYVTSRQCRAIPGAVIQTALNGMGWDDDDEVNTRFKFIINTTGSARRIVVQIQASRDCGQTYVDITGAGNDPLGQPYIANFTGTNTYNSAIWVSDNVNWNDQDDDGATLAKQNVLQTKNAPFKPTMTFNERPEAVGMPDLSANDLVLVRQDNNDQIQIDDYVGVEDYDFEVYNATQDTTIYLQQRLKDLPMTEPSASTFDTYTIEGNPNDGGANYDYESGVLTISPTAGGAYTIIDSNGLVASQQTQSQPVYYKCRGIINPESRPIELMGDGFTERKYTKHEVHNTLISMNLGDSPNDHDTSLGADLSRKTTLFVGQINEADRVNPDFQNAPVYLNSFAKNESGGTIRPTIGGEDNIYLTPTAGTDARLFRSEIDTQTFSRDAMLNISIDEFSGLRSHTGIDRLAGKNLSGMGKVLASLPKEEFRSTAGGIQVNGNLVYVAPFENWIDINNGQELNINQLSVAVREPNGTLAGDLVPDSMLQIKIREDPKMENRRMMEKQHEMLTLALSSAQRTAGILSTNLSQVGS